MHPNPAFRQTPAADSLSLARSRGFGLLMVNGDAGPLVSHVPFLLDAAGAVADLHLSRGNPICRIAQPVPAVIAVSGADAYISPDWYGPHEAVPDQVPTWNYVAVHLRGVLDPLPPEALCAHVDALSAEHEARIAGKRPWTSAKMTPGAIERLMRMILPFRLRVETVEGTWKLNQNKASALRAGVVAALERGDAGARGIAALMRALPD
ncbi:FMN-binding negative transcriptional regulator [Xinfangfangia pollutisoli]|uniref:FMN-binding negative transcriptional regulator n=1 Tax=Xinfangfangia pollutisoli TaxID=2865960 RepID=UPI001CD229B8|nr:FMN-binding negative transcriptional regulator [Xinfangfangia pollutisoli]